MRVNILKKPIVATLLYTILITLALMLADLAFAYSNENFIFQITRKEFLNKLFWFVLIVSFIAKKKFRLAIFLLVVVASFVQYTHFEYFGKNIGGIDFYLIQGNVKEVVEIFSTMKQIIIKPSIIAITLFFVIYIIDLKFGANTYQFKVGIYLLFIGLLLISAQVFYVSNIKTGDFSDRERHKDSKLIYPTTNRHSARNFFISANYFLFGIVPKKLINSGVEFAVLEKPKLINNNVNRTIILVLGESLRFDKFNLDGNKLTPKLQTLKNSDSFFFKKVYSGGTMTKVSFSTLIHRIKNPGGLRQITEEDNCLFKLAKENQFNTYFLSAQNTWHLQIIRDMMCPKYIDKLIERDTFDSYMKPTGYDEDLQTLIGQLDDKLGVLKPNNFIVLQQRGSHTPYEKQYPVEFDKFSPYENTALYTDHSLYNLITFVNKQAKGETFIFYVSDHGELLGENGKKGHGHLTKEVYEVPFVMLTNTKDTAIKKQFETIRSHYDISNYILTLLGYEADLHGAEDREIMILNADLDGFSGYGTINVKDGVESEIQIKKH